MTRVVVFCAFLISVVLVMNLNSFQDINPSQEKFDFEKEKSAHEAKIAEREELEKMRLHQNEPEVNEEASAPKVVIDLSTPQLQKGHELFKKCIACHGAEGQGKKSQKAPRIGGQLDWYVVKQLTDMKEGRRINKVMEPYLKPLEASDIADLGVYISKLPWKE